MNTLSAEQLESEYYRVKASGLVPAEELMRLYWFVQDNTASALDTICGDIAEKEPMTVRRLQQLARLKKLTPDNEKPETRNYSSPFYFELYRQGYLNHWQIEQFLAGRSKFSLDQYLICDALGQGGYGHLFLAFDTATSSFVAVKVLPLSKQTPELAERFQYEISLQKNLQHTNVCKLLSNGVDGSVAYMVHEFIDGGDLRQLLRPSSSGKLCSLPFPLAAAIAAQTARALQYIHSFGIIHRDVKPGNVLLSSGGLVKLIDFGLAYSIFGGADYPLPPNKVAGTVDYMAPEQLRSPNEPVEAWDVYSLGVMLYQMLTGEVPFPNGDQSEKFQQKLQLDPKDPRLVHQNIPFDIVQLLRLMTAKEPTARSELTAKTIAERLENWIPIGGLKRDLTFG